MNPGHIPRIKGNFLYRYYEIPTYLRNTELRCRFRSRRNYPATQLHAMSSSSISRTVPQNAHSLVAKFLVQTRSKNLLRNLSVLRVVEISIWKWWSSRACMGLKLKPVPRTGTWAKCGSRPIHNIVGKIHVFWLSYKASNLKFICLLNFNELRHICSNIEVCHIKLSQV